MYVKRFSIQTNIIVLVWGCCGVVFWCVFFFFFWGVGRIFSCLLLFWVLFKNILLHAICMHVCIYVCMYVCRYVYMVLVYVCIDV